MTRALAAVVMMSSFLFIVFKMGHLYVCLLVVILQTMIFNELVVLRYRKIKNENEPNIRWFRTIQWFWFVAAMVYAYGSSFLKAPMGGEELLGRFKKAIQRVGIVEEVGWLFFTCVFLATLGTDGPPSSDNIRSTRSFKRYRLHSIR